MSDTPPESDFLVTAENMLRFHARATKAEIENLKNEQRIKDLLQYTKSLAAAYEAMRNERDAYKKEAETSRALLNAYGKLWK
jgi:hypothetical protein